MDIRLSPHEQRGDESLGRFDVQAEKLAFGALEAERQRQLVTSLPRVPAHGRHAGGKILASGRVRRRRLRASSRSKVELSQPLALLERCDQCRTTTELAHGLEDHFLDLVRWDIRLEPSTESEMQRGSLTLGNEAVGRFSYAVVRKRVGAAETEHEPRAHGLPERGVDV